MEDNKKPSLFVYFYPQAYKNTYRRFLDWWKENKLIFLAAFSISMAVHIALIVLFYVLPPIPPQTHQAIPPADSHELPPQVLPKRQASMTRTQTDTRDVRTPESSIPEYVRSMEISGAELQERERAGLYQDVLRAYSGLQEREPSIRPSQPAIPFHLIESLRKKGGISLDSGTKVFLAPPLPGGNKLSLKALSREKLKELSYVQQLKAVNETFHNEGNRVRIQTPATDRFIPTAYFLRECPYEELLATGADLFYIIRGFPPFGRNEVQDHQLTGLLLEARQIRRSQASQSADIKTTFPNYRTIYSPLTVSRKQSLEKIISSGKVMQALDELMTQPEVEQFLQYKRLYLDLYDPNNDELAALTGEFIHNNLTNIIFILSDISTTFDYLEEIFYGKFLDYQLYGFWSQHPDSKVGAELLLASASRYELERRALQYLYRAYGAAREFLEKNEFDSDIYNKKAKCLVIKEVYEDLDRRLQERGFQSQEEVMAAYVREEATIYHRLIRTGKQERNHGLFARGCLWWNSGLHDEALKDWELIDTDFWENETFQELSTVISEAEDRQEMISRINTMLEAYESEGSEQLLLRLLQFGRWQTRTNSLER